MTEEFEYDVFISFNGDDEQRASNLYKQLHACGLNVFFAPVTIKEWKPEANWAATCNPAAANSQVFVLLASRPLETNGNVMGECTTFHEARCTEEKKSHDTLRAVFLLMLVSEENEQKSARPAVFPSANQTEDDAQILQWCVQTVLKARAYLAESLGTQANGLKISRARFRNKLRRYAQQEFWSRIVEDKEVHVFLCGRDEKSNRGRVGEDGRTAIDMWDYKTVLKLNRYFAYRHPNVNVEIEDPIPKMLEPADQQANFFREEFGKLRDKHCIIVGSPDVSDFAEVVLAGLHKLRDFKQEPAKEQGFVNQKTTTTTTSALYRKGDPEAVIRISDNQAFPGPDDPKRDEIVYGTLTVAPNPSSESGHKVMIFSGLSGIATYAIATLLTEDDCAEELEKMMEALDGYDGAVEILVGARFASKTDPSRDSRKLIEGDGAIFYEDIAHIH